ncbi:RDD family protein [Pseudoxanthomonas dokdonensis]|uniref:RDD family protein n=1 Tax=Pseudoxanthomonas dokdonensis TaxID=344882 RepID=A0A0R0CTD0_9GAMM|nr:RDD family protein [Pseudoxanthomonas dokdonensis]KRG69351.1 hypothetical protein ABB29_09620 [Pseudoxanthomonas dokdonensis]
MTQWFFADELRQRQGPIDQSVLPRHFRDGRVTLDTLVWRDGMPQWQRLGDFADELDLLGSADASGLPAAAILTPAPPVQPAAPAAESVTAIESEVETALALEPALTAAAEATASRSGEPAHAPAPAPVAAASGHGRAVFTAREPSQQYVPPTLVDAAATLDTPYAPPRASIAATTAVVSDGEVVYAGFWKRVAACLIDSIVITVAGGVVGAIIGGLIGAGFGFNGGLGSTGIGIIQIVSNLVSISMAALYYAWFHSSANLATLGKMAIGIKVVRSNGEPISFLRGIGRYFGYLLSCLVFYIGVIMAGLTERKRALHDMLCDTVVVDKWAFTRYPERQRHELGTVTVVILVLGALLVVGSIILFGAVIFALLGAYS